MRDDIARLPEQLRWRPDPPAWPGASVDSLILIGMGGSAMAASAAALVSPVPTTCHRGYGLPASAARPLVVGVTYSGNTEETLDGLRSAREEGFPIAVVSSGGEATDLARDNGWPRLEVPAGLQPRAALGYQVSAVASLVGTAFGASSAGDLAEAADLVEDTIASGSALADDLADAIGHRVPVVYGTNGPGALAATRWKTQINENAKRPAFAQEIPEANHNDLQGWFGPDGGAGFAAVMLHDDGAEQGLRARSVHTTAVMSSQVTIAGSVRSVGQSPLARFFTLAAIGDLVSVTLAETALVDPTPVTALEDFKRTLMATAPPKRKETP